MLLVTSWSQTELTCWLQNIMWKKKTKGNLPKKQNEDEKTKDNLPPKQNVAEKNKRQPPTKTECG